MVKPVQLSRKILENGRLDVERIGLDQAPLKDLFHFLMMARWRWFLAVWISFYVLLNTIFAALYVLLGAQIENAAPGSLLDAFFFSVQTMSTIGFGHLAPGNIAANALVGLESIVGLLGTAMTAGMIFAKFSRPTSRLYFSRCVASGRRDHRPALTFRVGNQRGNIIMNATMKLTLTYLEFTPEDELVRRFIPLKIERPHNELFSLVWQGTHFLDADSPLSGNALATLEALQAQLLVAITGIDQDLGQTIQSSYAYTHENVVDDARLADMFSERSDGRRAVDFRQFHETLALPTEAGSGN